MSNKDRRKSENNEAEVIYRIYQQVQAGNQAALNGLFRMGNGDRTDRAEEQNEIYQLSHTDHILDLDTEEKIRETERISSAETKVSFRFSCLNKMLCNMRRKFLSDSLNTSDANGRKNHGCSKFCTGAYDISDFNELMYETVIEIFTGKTDENNCLTLDGKKNKNYPIDDEISLLENISYFTSRKINRREKISCRDALEIKYHNWESETEYSYLDQYVMKEFLHSEGASSRLMMYADYLDWIKRNDVKELFKVNSRNIRAIIETIMNCEETFTADTQRDVNTGSGMHLVTQKALQEIISTRYNIWIEQENISKDLEIIEQRLLDHLLYSLNYCIGKAPKSKKMYEKESERFLYERDEKTYVKIFSRTGYELYNQSSRYISNHDFDGYTRVLRKNEDSVIEIVSAENGKKKYEMLNWLLQNNDLINNKKAAVLNIAETICRHYQKAEAQYLKNELETYKMRGLKDQEDGRWEAELYDEILKIRLFSNEKIKKPVLRYINRKKLTVYSGCINYYFCDTEQGVCYRLPKTRRVISRANKNHEIIKYKID